MEEYMQIINLPRGWGKTTRAIYLSELYNIPILVSNRITKNVIKNKAKIDLNAKIPEPVLISELGKVDLPNGIIVDEAINTLVSIIRANADFPIDVKAITISVPEKSDDFLDVDSIQTTLNKIKQEISELPNCQIKELQTKCNLLTERINYLQDYFTKQTVG